MAVQRRSTDMRTTLNDVISTWSRVHPSVEKIIHRAKRKQCNKRQKFSPTQSRPEIYRHRQDEDDRIEEHIGRPESNERSGSASDVTKAEGI